MFSSNPKLTRFERAALDERFNLADGHARNYLEQFWESYYRAGDVLSRSNSIPQHHIEGSFISTFRECFGQSTLSIRQTLLLPSASLSLELIANALRMQGRITMLAPEPCFDNVIDIFRRHGCVLLPYSVETDFAQDLITKLKTAEAAALLLVLPTNPTGHVIGERDFAATVELCAERGVILVVDASFRAFDPDLARWDMYSLLDSSNVSYAVIEDTGKLLATHELKVSTLTCDSESVPLVESIYEDILLAHSPLVVIALTDLLQKLGSSGLRSLARIAETNRHALRKTPLARYITVPSPRGSVEWLRFENGTHATDVMRRLAIAGVAVLPGHPFYWSGPRNEGYIRVALMRDSDYFLAAMRQVTEALSGNNQNSGRT